MEGQRAGFEGPGIRRNVPRGEFIKQLFRVLTGIGSKIAWPFNDPTLRSRPSMQRPHPLHMGTDSMFTAALTNAKAILKPHQSYFDFVDLCLASQHESQSSRNTKFGDFMRCNMALKIDHRSLFQLLEEERKSMRSRYRPSSSTTLVRAIEDNLDWMSKNRMGIAITRERLVAAHDDIQTANEIFRFHGCELDVILRVRAVDQYEYVGEVYPEDFEFDRPGPRSFARFNRPSWETITIR